ncbi:MAG: hypothetical protein JSS81_17215 [Acidobacteria bacterium]|nr:hypothetical protein [Acidobacteriota bacterium]
MTETAKKILRVSRRRDEFLIRRRAAEIRLFCADCAAERDFLSCEDAVCRAGLSTRAIVGLVEDGRLHFAESRAGQLFVCAASLADLTDGGPEKGQLSGGTPRKLSNGEENQ